MREEYDRAKLLDEVWAEPVMVVAPRYGLSDVGLKKLCTRLQVPTPTRGHWAKVKVFLPNPDSSPIRATPAIYSSRLRPSVIALRSQR